MTVILGTAYEALPGKAAAFAATFTKGTALIERLGAKVHRLQGYIGASPTVLVSVLEVENFLSLSEFAMTRDEDRDWQEFVQFVTGAPTAQLVRSFEAAEIHELDTSAKIKSGAVHTTMLAPIPEKFPTLIQQLSELKEAHEKEGARVHAYRYTTGEDTSKLGYTVEFDDVIELGRFADKLERNMQYRDLMAKIYADASCSIVRAQSYKAFK